MHVTFLCPREERGGRDNFQVTNSTIYSGSKWRYAGLDSLSRKQPPSPTEKKKKKKEKKKKEHLSFLPEARKPAHAFVPCARACISCSFCVKLNFLPTHLLSPAASVICDWYVSSMYL